MNIQDLYKALAESAGTIVLALLAGAGGSALLELYWKPRRDRKRASALLGAEIEWNASVLESMFRNHGERSIPGGVRMSVAAWEMAGDLATELPAAELESAIVLYHLYGNLNRIADKIDSLDEELRLAAGDLHGLHAGMQGQVRATERWKENAHLAAGQSRELLRALGRTAAVIPLEAGR